MITYHNHTAAALALSETLPAAADLLEPDEQPTSLLALYIDGRQDLTRRRSTLAQLGAPGPDTVVISNARVLAEGVDSVDAVAFLSARDSAEATAQAAGRALRRDGRPEKIATIIIPVVLGPDQTPESALMSIHGQASGSHVAGPTAGPTSFHFETLPVELLSPV